MKVLYLLLLLSLCWLPSWGLQNVYITADGSCSTANGTVLEPCCTLNQLGNLSSHVLEPSMALLFLPGTHMLEKQLGIDKFEQVVMSPLSMEDKVVINCEQNETFFLGRNHTITKISSLQFTTCNLVFIDNFAIDITESTFEKSIYIALLLSCDVNCGRSHVNIANSRFLSNAVGGITAIGQPQQDLPQHGPQLSITNTLFQDNGYDSGPASYVDGVLVLYYQYTVYVNNSMFMDNTRTAIAAYYSTTLNLVNSTFYNNSNNPADEMPGGSAMRVINVGALSITNCFFVDNSAEGNGTIFIENSKNHSITRSWFQGNVASGMGGAIYFSESSTLDLRLKRIRDCQFVNNSAKQGGALWLSGSRVGANIIIFISMSSFTSNKAEQGGAVYSESRIFFEDDSFTSNSAKSNGGAVYLSKITNSGSMRNVTVSSNTALNGGGAVYLSQSTSSDMISVNFSSNTALIGGGAVYLSQSTYCVMRNVTFSSNTALDGGAMYAKQSSSISAGSITVVNNVAHDKGGAIYVLDESCDQYSCRMTYSTIDSNTTDSTFSNNTASQGQILYGGLLDRCFVSGTNGDCFTTGIDYFKKYSHYDTTVRSAISSDPVRVCLCNENSEVDCATRNMTIVKQRGQTINLKIAVVDQDSNAKEGIVRASYVGFLARLGEGEERQQTGDNCTNNMLFHVFARHDSVVQLVLRPEGICQQSNFSRVTVDINLIPCSIGFAIKTNRCECDPRLSDYVTSCDVDALTIQTKNSRAWVHYDEQFLKAHSNCPLDYCNVSLAINLMSQDEQCANYRSGIICGSCQENHSIALGGSKCLDCSSSIAYAWLIPVFAVAGIALVALLLVCNMTVSHGTLNGLIFYANVVSISGLTTFQDCSVNPLLSVFIAWINLDFGIETCFYPGMDTYQKAWLQYVFPLYIWILVGVIILVSRYSTKAVKVFGKNNISVLATLFLLSYSKFLKTIITALSVTQVFRGIASNTSDPLVPYSVWLYNGNIEYLNTKHFPLFAVALGFLIFLFLPYTLLLTFGQCLRSIRSRNKCVLWFINSTAFVSIMDAYHAPYTNRHRYWTGFMLLVRCVIFLGFASSFDNSFSDIYIAVVCLATVFSLRAFISKIYRNIGVNLLEVIFLLNLTVLFVSVLYLQRNDSSDEQVLCKCATASISISLVLFICILVYHAYIRIKSRKFFKSAEDWLLVKWQFFRHQYKHAKPTDDHELPEANLTKHPTTTYVELREELLEN